MNRWTIFVIVLIPLFLDLSCTPSIQEIPADRGPAPTGLEKSPFTIRLDSSFPMTLEEEVSLHFIQPDEENALLDSGQSFLARGIEALDDSRFEEAFHIFHEGEETEPWLADYHCFFQIKAQTGFGRLQAAVGMCLAFEKQFPESPLMPHIRAARAELFRKLGAAYLAIAAYEKAIDGHPDTGARAELLYKLGSLYEQNDDLPSALSAYIRLREEAPLHSISPEARRKIREIYSRAPSLIPPHSPEALFTKASLLQREGDYLSAARLFCELEACYPYDDQSVKALYRGGRCYARARRRDEALQVYERLAREHPHSPEACPALYEAGRIHWNADRSETASRTFKKILARYPQCKKVADAAFILGRLYQGDKQFDEAIQYYRFTYEKYPKSTHAPEALWREGWIYYMRGLYREAAAAFEKVGEAFPDSRYNDNALYWQARSTERLGNAASACALYDLLIEGHPNSYYGILGAWRRGMFTTTQYKQLKSDPPIMEKKGQPDRNHPVHLPAPGPEAMEILRRARALIQGNEKNLARTELRRLDPRSLNDAGLEILLSSMYRQVGSYSRSILLAGSVYNRFRSSRIETLPPGTLEGIYPLGYLDLISEHSMKHRLDPFLVAGLIRQESIFNPECRSRAGALGLMQIIPSTGKRLSDQAGLENFKNSQLWDPDLNIQLGTLYLANLVERYQGDLTRVLAAYNAGEKAVERWEKRFPDMERDEFVEIITYPETRNYVKLVIRNREMYRRIYTTDANPGS